MSGSDASEDIRDEEDRLPCRDPEGCADCLWEEKCARERAQTRPLFDHSYGDMSRNDEWSGPHGFLFEPMTSPTQLEMAQQFLDAADQLVDGIRSEAVADYTIANPALYLYRHAIELVLKCALGGDRWGHNLNALTDELAQRCRDQHGQEAPTWIIDRLKEIAAADPRSTTFRYVGQHPPTLVAGNVVVTDYYVDLHHLQRSMTVLYEALSSLVGKISPVTPPGSKGGKHGP